MKKIIIVSILSFSFGNTLAQTIEKLQSFKQVAAFLEKEINKEYTFDIIFKGEDEIDTEDFNEVVQKIDLDNNGTTDLVIDTIGVLIYILNKDNNTYEEIKILPFDRIRYDEDIASISMEKINDKTLFIREIKLSEFETTNLETTIVKKNQRDFVYDKEKNEFVEEIRDVKFEVDTLEVKFGTFVQLHNRKQKIKDKIKEIHFEATPCYGSCPAFELKLTSDGSLDYLGKSSINFKGRKKTKLNKAQVDELFALIEYTDVKSLKDHYAIIVTDNPSAILKVIFKNGDVKEIIDYGRFGTYNLRVIYEKIFEISNNIK